MRSSLLAHPTQAQTSSVPMMTSTNPTALAYSGIPNPSNNKMHSTIPVTRMPQHHQYQPLPPPQQQQQARVVSPRVSPILPREQIMVRQNRQHSPPHLPSQLGHSPMNINQNAMGWQHPAQLQQQINPARSYDSEELETASDVSSIHMGSIRPDPNYDPAKDPLSPENIDKPFVAPLEITIRVVKGRRRKTLGSQHSSTTHTTHTTLSTAGSTRYSVEEDKHQLPVTTSEWHHSPKHPTTQNGSGSIPELGLINSSTSDSNSFSGSDQFQSAEELMYLEKDLLELQEGQNEINNINNEETKQRKGMVRREFNRRIMRFKKHKKRNKNGASNNNNNTSNEFSGDDFDNNDDDSDASGNKIIIKLKIDDVTMDKDNVPEQPPKQTFKNKNHLYPTTFGGMLKHRRSNSMQLIVGQENGC